MRDEGWWIGTAGLAIGGLSVILTILFHQPIWLKMTHRLPFGRKARARRRSLEGSWQGNATFSDSVDGFAKQIPVKYKLWVAGRTVGGICTFQQGADSPELSSALRGRYNDNVLELRYSTMQTTVEGFGYVYLQLAEYNRVLVGYAVGWNHGKGIGCYACKVQLTRVE